MNEDRTDYTENYSVCKGFGAVKKCLQVYHVVELAFGHSDTFEHGEFFLTKFHIRCDRIEDVGDSYESYHCDESIEENLNDQVYGFVGIYYAIDVLNGQTETHVIDIARRHGRIGTFDHE